MIEFHIHLEHLERQNVHEIINHLDSTGAQVGVLLPLEGFPVREIRTEVVLAAVREYPGRLLPFCSVDPKQSDAVQRLESLVAQGCCGLGEQKVAVPVDHPGSIALYKACGELDVPVLIHFEEGTYNLGFERFEEVIKANPQTTFIGHAQTFWANIGRDPESLYPKGKVKPGGITDSLLSDYENVWADLSAGSGLNALTRDSEFAYSFIRRHRTKLLWASDCPCLDGNGAGFSRGRCIAQDSQQTLRSLCDGDHQLYQQITDGNARQLLQL